MSRLEQFEELTFVGLEYVAISLASICILVATPFAIIGFIGNAIKNYIHKEPKS